MARFSGKNGKLLLGATQLHIDSWNLTDMVDTPDATDSESAGWKRRVVGLSDFSGDFTGKWDDTTSPIGQGFAPGAEGTLKLYLNGSLFYSGTVIISELSPSVDIGGGDTVKFKGQFVGNGVLTRPA